MKIEDLMINDYIEIENIGIVKVNSIHRDSIEVLLLNNNGKFKSTNAIVITDFNKIKSISITEEFLLRNEFNKDTCNHYIHIGDTTIDPKINYIYFLENPYNTIYMYYANNDFCFDFSDNNMSLVLNNVHYVHELQHILRICNIKLNLQL